MRYRLRTLLIVLVCICLVAVVVVQQIWHRSRMAQYDASVDAIYVLGGRMLPDKRPFLHSASIDLRGTSLGDDNLSQLRGLAYGGGMEVDVSGTQVSDVGLRHFTELNIYRLRLNGTRVTKDGVEWLKQARPEMDVVWNEDR